MSKNLTPTKPGVFRSKRRMKKDKTKLKNPQSNKQIIEWLKDKFK